MTEEEYGSGLRGKIVDVICEEWPKGDNGLEASAILERLQREGVEASEGALVSEEDVANVLIRMSGRGDIELMPSASYHPTTDLVITGIRENLC